MSFNVIVHATPIAMIAFGIVLLALWGMVGLLWVYTYLEYKKNGEIDGFSFVEAIGMTGVMVVTTLTVLGVITFTFVP